jgi:hypothetical protein
VPFGVSFVPLPNDFVSCVDTLLDSHPHPQGLAPGPLVPALPVDALEAAEFVSFVWFGYEYI